MIAAAISDALLFGQEYYNRLYCRGQYLPEEMFCFMQYSVYVNYGLDSLCSLTHKHFDTAMKQGTLHFD